jgi:hypothetical protein
MWKLSRQALRKGALYYLFGAGVLSFLTSAETWLDLYRLRRFLFLSPAEARQNRPNQILVLGALTLLKTVPYLLRTGRALCVLHTANLLVSSCPTLIANRRNTSIPTSQQSGYKYVSARG